MTKPSKTLWVRVDPADHAAAVALAMKFGVSLSDLVRVLVKQALRVDLDAPAGAVLPGIYLPDPETVSGAAEIDEVIDHNDPGPEPTA